MYEVNLVAYNGNGESGCSKRLVSLTEEGTNAKTSGECPINIRVKSVLNNKLYFLDKYSFFGDLLSFYLQVHFSVTLSSFFGIAL